MTEYNEINIPIETNQTANEIENIHSQVDSIINNDITIHKNPDAAAWAKFFCEINPPEKTGLDEGLMVLCGLLML